MIAGCQRIGGEKSHIAVRLYKRWRNTLENVSSSGIKGNGMYQAISLKLEENAWKSCEMFDNGSEEKKRQGGGGGE